MSLRSKPLWQRLCCGVYSALLHAAQRGRPRRVCPGIPSCRSLQTAVAALTLLSKLCAATRSSARGRPPTPSREKRACWGPRPRCHLCKPNFHAHDGGGFNDEFNESIPAISRFHLLILNAQAFMPAASAGVVNDVFPYPVHNVALLQTAVAVFMVLCVFSLVAGGSARGRLRRLCPGSHNVARSTRLKCLVLAIVISTPETRGSALAGLAASFLLLRPHLF